MLGEPYWPLRLQMGLVNRVVADAAAAPDRAQALARQLARGPNFAALGMTKTMLNREMNWSLEQALEAEAQAQQICMHHRGLSRSPPRVRRKREPQWKGR